jgi:Xaa-Pro aminopeptidase
MNRHRLSLALALFALLVSALASVAAASAAAKPGGRKSLAAPELPGISLEEHRDRRARLAAALRGTLADGETGVLVLRAGSAAGEDSFQPDPNFLYLTGFDGPDAALVVTIPAAGKGEVSETLFIPPRDRAAEKWTGETIGAGADDPATGEPDPDRRRAREATGFANIERSDQLVKSLDAKGILPAAAILWTRLDTGPLDADPTPAQRFVERVKRAYPQLKVADAGPSIVRLRWVKSPAEIGLMQRAVDITLESLREAMRAALGAGREFEIQGVIDGGFRRLGATSIAFPSIVAAGRNATILHYEKNRGPVSDGDLVLMDVGAAYRAYDADVSRTIPASGRFSPRQRELYELVLKAQAEAAAVIKPGVTMAQVHARAKDVLAAAGYDKYFLHYTSHSLGLEVHDPSERTWPLEPGVVLTVEPGLYIPAENIGIRIEDDYVVTETGFRRLSAGLVSDVPGLEKTVLAGAGPNH